MPYYCFKMTENSAPTEEVSAEAGDSFMTADGQANSSDVINDIVKSVESNDDLIVGQVLEAVISSPDLDSTSPTTTTPIVDDIPISKETSDDKVHDVLPPANEDQQNAQVEMMDVEEENREEIIKEPEQGEGQLEGIEADDKLVEKEKEEDDGIQEIEMVQQQEQLEDGSGEPSTCELVSQETIVLDEEDINEDAPEFVIERVVDKKLNNEGKPLWLVKWQNYSFRENTWEPLEHLVECDKQVQEFELARAKMIAERHDEEKAKNANGQAGPRRKPMMPRHKEFEILDVMGLTKVEEEKYFLVTIANSTKKGFIRESIANRIIPNKVIDFYIKNLQWKAVSSPEAKNV